MSQKIAPILIFAVFCLTLTACEDSISGECGEECLDYLDTGSDTGSEPDTMEQYCNDSGGMDLEREKITEIAAEKDNCFSGNIYADKNGNIKANPLDFKFFNWREKDSINANALKELNNNNFECIKRSTTRNSSVKIEGNSSLNSDEIEQLILDSKCNSLDFHTFTFHINNEGIFDPNKFESYFDYSYDSDSETVINFVQCIEASLQGKTFPCLESKYVYWERVTL